MKAMLVGAVLAVGALHPVLAGAASAGQGLADQLKVTEATANDRCRGDSGDNTETRSWCATRDQLDAALRGLNWCWGPDDAIGADKHWVRCSRENIPAATHHQKAPEPSTESWVSAATLGKAYAANEIAADRQYGSRTLVVTGTISGIKKDYSGNAYVEFASSQFGWRDVEAYLSPEMEQAAADYRIGQTLSLACDSVGMEMLSPTLHHCHAPTPADVPPISQPNIGRQAGGVEPEPQN